MKKQLLITSFIFTTIVSNCFAQVSPPGLGKTNIGSWIALGIRQELDTVSKKGWQSMTYVGYGRKSNPDNFNPVYKPAIFVLNQEFYHQFHSKWQYSFAISYRQQKEYQAIAPFENADPSIQHEFRLYGRLSYKFQTARLKLTPTFRQEFRKYYAFNSGNGMTDFQLRSRFRLQLTINLDKSNNHRLIASSEQLFSISKENIPNSWTDFNYRETRLSLYYSYSPTNLPFIFSFGYMNNIVGRKSIYDVHTFAFDVVIENPFKMFKRAKESIIENLE